jgi:prepilin peptidase CpaA
MVEVSPGVIWFLAAVLIEAAYIDGKQLRVPNWLTFHLVLGGWAFAAWSGGAAKLLWSLEGAALGLALLLPLYAIGGMGAGDVKLMAGIGAWVGPTLTLGAFVATAVVGGVIAVAMVVRSGEVRRHWDLFRLIGLEIFAIRNPAQLAAIAAERKPTMLLLPYGIPIAIGTIGYFAWRGLLF